MDYDVCIFGYICFCMFKMTKESLITTVDTSTWRIIGLGLGLLDPRS